MSVAFRRDSDEEHLEPRFELPVPPGPNLVTPRGLAQIEVRSAELESLAAATADPDARKIVERDLRYWRGRLVTAQLAPPATGDTVAFGTSVTFEQAGRIRTLAIVGHDESDPATDRLAFAAPLARALIGAEEGDEVMLPGSSDPLHILAIAPAA